MGASPWRLDGKKVLVTGGTKGIGRAVVQEALQLGAEVMTVARNNHDLENLQKELLSQDFDIYTFSGDMGDAKDRKALFDQVKTQWGSLDVLVNNAGVNIRKNTLDYTIRGFKKDFCHQY